MLLCNVSFGIGNSAWQRHTTPFSSGLISAFGQFFIKPGHIEPKFHKYITEAFDLRQESDYQPTVEITEKQAGKLLERAKEFTEVCRKFCQ